MCLRIVSKDGSSVWFCGESREWEWNGIRGDKFEKIDWG